MCVSFRFKQSLCNTFEYYDKYNFVRKYVSYCLRQCLKYICHYSSSTSKLDRKKKKQKLRHTDYEIIIAMTYLKIYYYFFRAPTFFFFSLYVFKNRKIFIYRSVSSWAAIGCMPYKFVISNEKKKKPKRNNKIC